MKRALPRFAMKREHLGSFPHRRVELVWSGNPAPQVRTLQDVERDEF